MFPILLVRSHSCSNTDYCRNFTFSEKNEIRHVIPIIYLYYYGFNVFCGFRGKNRVVAVNETRKGARNCEQIPVHSNNQFIIITHLYFLTFTNSFNIVSTRRKLQQISILVWNNVLIKLKDDSLVSWFMDYIGSRRIENEPKYILCGFFIPNAWRIFEKIPHHFWDLFI